MKKLSSLFFLFVLVFPRQGLAGSRFLMAALGDSGTVGTSAETPLGELGLSAFVTWGGLFHALLFSRSASLARRTFDGRLAPNGQISDNRYRLSWATGTEILSHYVLLQEYLRIQDPNSRLDAFNVARVGARTADLPAQARFVSKLVREGKYDSLKYVVIAAGVNDVAMATGPDSGMTDDDALTRNIKAALHELAVSNGEPVRVLVLPIPQFLADLGRPEVKGRRVLPGLRSETLRPYLGFAKYWSEWSTQDGYRERIEVLAKKNRAIERAVEEFRQEVSPERLEPVFAALPHTEIDFDYSCIVAADACHPSKEGHSRLATMTWDWQPWFKLPCLSQIAILPGRQRK